MRRLIVQPSVAIVWLLACVMVGRAQTSALRIATEPVPDGVSGRAYSLQLHTTGGQAPLTWRVQSGQLPPGLRLNPSAGVIFGLPIAEGAWEAAIAVTDAAKHTARVRVRIHVALPLVLEIRSIPNLISGSLNRVPLATSGGIGPLRWQIVAGGLPRGLQLDPLNGLIVGQTSDLGPFTFTVRVTDSSNPRQAAERTFTQRVLGPLTADWVNAPATRDNGIYGSLRVLNSTQDNVDLTVIVVAVNEFGKAFALGYQHFVLNRETESQEIPFGFNLPRGTYTVRADAVGEVPQTNTIQRAFQETRTLTVE